MLYDILIYYFITLLILAYITYISLHLFGPNFSDILGPSLHQFGHYFSYYILGPSLAYINLALISFLIPQALAYNNWPYVIGPIYLLLYYIILAYTFIHGFVYINITIFCNIYIMHPLFSDRALTPNSLTHSYFFFFIAYITSFFYIHYLNKILIDQFRIRSQALDYRLLGLMLLVPILIAYHIYLSYKLYYQIITLIHTFIIYKIIIWFNRNRKFRHNLGQP